MPPATAVPSDHGSTVPNTLGGNTIIAIIISVIISVIAIGWLAYCCYTRHIGYGVSIDAGHPNLDAGDGYIAVYTPRYTRDGYTRPRREQPPPRRKGPRRIMIHHVPSQDHRYRVVRGVFPSQHGAQSAVSGDAPRAQQRENNQTRSNAQQQQKQQNQNQGKKKQKSKKNKQKNNSNQSGQGNNQSKNDDQNNQGSNQESSNNPDQGGWNPPQAEDDQQQEEEGREEPAWGDNNQDDNNQAGDQDGWVVPDQNQDNNWSNQQNDQTPNSPRPSAVNGAMTKQSGWFSG